MNDFDKYINELKNIYATDPEKATREAHEALMRMGKIDNKEHKGLGIISDISKDKLLLGLLIIVIVVIGIKALLTSSEPEDAIMYFGGLIFFFAGYFIGNYVKGFGLIFLFSHGCTGFVIMIASLISTNINLKMFSDLGTMPKVYLGAAFLFALFGLIATSLYNLSDNLKNILYAKVIPLGCFTISLILFSFYDAFLKII